MDLRFDDKILLPAVRFEYSFWFKQVFKICSQKLKGTQNQTNEMNLKWVNGGHSTISEVSQMPSNFVK